MTTGEASCPATRKWRFKSRSRAHRRMIRVTKKAGPGWPRTDIQVYECPHCGGWHFGHVVTGRERS